MKIHILGASGAGVTTIGRALAAKYNLRDFDGDDFYWEKTDPPFAKANPIEVRCRLLDDQLYGLKSWVLHGSIDSWSEPYVSQFDLVVFVEVLTAIRLARLRERERREFGDRILPGGDMFDNHEEFIVWAGQYDQGLLPGRSRPRHEAWLARLHCPVLRIDGNTPVANIIEQIGLAIKEHSLR